MTAHYQWEVTLVSGMFEAGGIPGEAVPRGRNGQEVFQERELLLLALLWR